MQVLAIDMVRNFVKNFPEITIKGVLADALYGTGEFMGQISQITGGAQVVSQIRSNQIVSNRNSQARIDQCAQDHESKSAGETKKLAHKLPLQDPLKDYEHGFSTAKVF